jgi:hypothetical protein
MHYEGPQDTDLENVRALNEAFLSLLQRSPDAREHLRGLQEDLARRLMSLTSRQRQRLAEAPFLLFSFRERDEGFWRATFDSNPHQDLFPVTRPLPDDLSLLIDAGLGFVWQLARQNPYALRLLCGASVHWCEQLADHTLMQILNFAATSERLLVLRLEHKAEIWTKLLYSGVHHHMEVRRAAQLSVLQTVLTQVEKTSALSWASAACRMNVPAMKVADENDA